MCLAKGEIIITCRVSFFLVFEDTLCLRLIGVLLVTLPSGIRW